MQSLGSICSVWDWLDSAVDSRIVTRFVFVMFSPFETRTAGPFFNVVMLSQYCL